MSSIIHKMGIVFIRRFSNQINFFNKKTCVDCRYFKNFQPFEKHDPNLNALGSCQLFPEKHLVTGQIYNITALECRKDEKKCGIGGKYFVFNRIK